MIFDFDYDKTSKKKQFLKQSLSSFGNIAKDGDWKSLWSGKRSEETLPPLLTTQLADLKISSINQHALKIKSGKSTWQKYFDTLDDSEKYIHSYIRATNDGKYSTESLMEANKAAIKTQTEHNKSLEVGGLKAKAGSVAMKGLSFGLNAVSNVAASLLIGSAITAIDNLIHRNENLIKSGKEAQQNISDTFQAYSQKSNVVSQVSDKYEELSKGVNSLTNQNISLSDSGYKEFLDISNQLAGVFPSIVSGYDSQGNAILNLGNNAQSAAEQLQSLLDVQKKSANVEIGDNLQTSYDGVIAQVHSYETDIEKYKKLKSEAEDNLSSIQSPYKSNGILNGLSKGLVTLNPATMDNVSRYVSEFNKALTQNNISPFSEILDDGKINIRFDADMPKDQMNNIQKDLSAFIEQQSEVYTADIADYNQKIEVAEMKTKDEWASLNAPISKYLQTSDSFSGLSENLQGALISNLNNIDISSLNGKYEGDMKTFLFSDFIKPMSDLTPDVQKQMGKLLELDPSKMTLDDYTKEWSNSLQEIFPDDSEAQSGWEKKLGFNNAFNNAIKDTQLLQKTFSSNGQDINNMSIGDREIAYDLIVNDKFTGSFDQLTERVASTKAELEKLEEPDLFNEWQQAEQSANSGDKYVQMANGLNKAKQLFDQGLVGTDDFKSYAAMISPTGMDDPANFEENYGKIKRYFNTDSNQGVLNFLDDLSTKTDESGKALASFDEESGKWAFNIKDMEGAAKQMGIGIEPLMSMFGRLEDYGISNNFVSSIEEGTEHVEKLYSQLAKEEETLKELQKPGQYETTDSNGNTSFTAGNQTAIDSTQEKINGLKGDIQETLGFMDELVNRSAEDYSTEVSSAKDTINKLAEQRKQVLDDGGTNSKEVSGMLEQQIQGLAEKYSITLDMNFEVGNEAELDSAIEEKRAEYKKTNDNLVLEPEVKTEKLQTLHDELLNLLRDKANLNQPIIMSMDTSGLDSEMSGAIGLLQQFYSGSKEIELEKSVDINADTTQAQAKVDGLKTQINGLSPEVKAKLQIDGLTTDEILAKITANEIALPPTVLKTKTGEVDDTTVKIFTPEPKVIPVSTGLLDTSSLPTSLPAIFQPVIALKSGGVLQNGNANANGTPLISSASFNSGVLGTAFANGTWGEPRSTTALTGELGQELVVRGNHFFTVGDNGAEMAHLKQGDIVFNHLQTRDILTKGYVNGRGKALFNGNALANGSASVRSNAFASGNARSDGTKEPKVFDWVSTSLKRLSDVTKQYFSQITDFVSSTFKKYRLEMQMKSIDKELAANRQGQNAYLERAKNVGLDEVYASKVRNGTIQIEDIGSEDLQKKIDKYQEFYDKAMDCSSAIQELTNSQLELFEQWANMPIEEAEKKIEKLSKKMELYESNYSAISSSSTANNLQIIQKQDELNKNKTKQKKAKTEKNQAQKEYNKSKENKKYAKDAKSVIKRSSLSKIEKDKQYKNINNNELISLKGLKGSDKKKAIKYNKSVKNLSKKKETLNKANTRVTTNERQLNTIRKGDYENTYDNYREKIRKRKSTKDEQETAKKNASTATKKLKSTSTTTKKAISKSSLSKTKKNELLEDVKSGKTVSTKGIKNKKLKKQIETYNKRVSTKKSADKTLESKNKAASTAESQFQKAKPTYVLQNEILNKELNVSRNEYKTNQKAEVKANSNVKTTSKSLKNKGNNLLKYSGLTSGQKKQISDGTRLDLGKIKNREALDAAKAYNAAVQRNNIALDAQKKAADNTAQSQSNLAQKMSEVANQQLENVQAWYQARNTYLSTNTDTISKTTERKKAQGKSVTEKDYNDQISSKTLERENLKSEKKNLEAEFNKKVKNGEIKEGTEDWYKWKNNIADISNSIIDCDLSLQQLNDEKKNIKVTNLSFAKDALDTENDTLQANISLKEKQGKASESADYKKLIANSKAQVTNLKAQNNEYRKQQAGLDKNSQKYQELQAKINANNASINSANQSQEEWNHTIENLPIEKLNKELDLLDAKTSVLKSQIELKKAQGKDLSATDYTSQIQANNDELKRQEEIKKKALINAQKYTPDNEHYQEYMKTYYAADAAINTITANNEELKDSMRDDIYFKNFERAKEAADHLRSSLDTVSSLINEDMMYDDDGKLTDFGVTKLSTSIKEYESYMGDIAAAQEKLKTIQSLKGSDGYSDIEYTEEIRKAEEELGDALKNTYNSREKILDIMKNQSKAELDAVFKVIDARKKLLQTKEDYYEYDKTLKGKSKELQLLKAQSAALEGVADAESRAQKARIDAQISDAQEELDDTVKQHVYQLQIDGLDELKTELQEDYDNYVKDLSRNLDEITNVIDAATSVITGSFETVGKTIEELLNQFGVTPTDLNLTGYASGGIVKAVKLNGDSGIASLKAGETVLTDKFTALLPDSIHTMDLFSKQMTSLVKPPQAIPKMDSSSYVHVTIGDIVLKGGSGEITLTDLSRFKKEMIKETTAAIYQDRRKAGRK